MKDLKYYLFYKWLFLLSLKNDGELRRIIFEDGNGVIGEVVGYSDRVKDDMQRMINKNKGKQ